MTSSSKATGMPGWLLLLGAMTALGPVSIDLYLPAFTLIEQSLGEGVERTLASYLIGVSIGQLLYGPLSDRFGRKPPLYVAFTLYAVGSVGCAFAGSMTALLVWRVVQALGGCAGMVIARAIVRDRCEPHEAARVFSTLMLIVGLAPIVAPMFGGWIVTVAGWRATFIVQALLGLALLAAVHRVLAESHRPQAAPELRIGSVLASYGTLLADRAFVAYSFVGSFVIAGIFCYIAGAPTTLTHLYGMSPQQFGWLMGLNGLGFILASQINLRGLRRRSPQTVLARAVWLPLILGAMLVALSMAGTPPLFLVVIVPVAYVTAIGLINPNAAALALARHGRSAGTASALMGSMQSVGSVLAGLAIGWWNDGTLGPLALLMTACALGAALSYLWLRMESREASG